MSAPRVRSPRKPHPPSNPRKAPSLPRFPPRTHHRSQKAHHRCSEAHPPHQVFNYSNNSAFQKLLCRKGGAGTWCGKPQVCPRAPAALAGARHFGGRAALRGPGCCYLHFSKEWGFSFCDPRLTFLRIFHGRSRAILTKFWRRRVGRGGRCCK